MVSPENGYIISMKIFTERLRELRVDKKLMQRELAEMIGVPVRTYGNWEIGASEPPMDMIVKLAKFFNVTTDYLLGMTEY